jgi:glycosyltransferase involved in cell wall biosynthesis
VGNGGGGYLAFLGRIAPEKGVAEAIDIARLARIPLRLAAKVDAVDRDYFTQTVEPRIDGTSVCFIGEINEREKTQFLGDALALLFPINWPEPFGLVMIEAMACGTPVVAFRHGSVPEIIDEGVTGMIVTNCAQAAAAVGRARELDRRRCRARFVERFSAERMAREYSSVYAALQDRRAAKRASPRSQQH